MNRCLILLCGPPACLKSTLMRILRCLLSPASAADPRLKTLCLNKIRSILQHPLEWEHQGDCVFLSFDQLFIDYQAEIIHDESQWKAYRNLIADQIEEEILRLRPSTRSSPHSLPHASAIVERFHRCLPENRDEAKIWIFEDNFYYSSMRHRYRQIAQRAQIGFATIHLYAEISVARQRNARRNEAERVSDRSMENIFSKYEFSPTDLRLDTTEHGLTLDHLDQVRRRIARACQEPEHFFDLQAEEERRQQATEINRQNLIYQLDQKLRKYLSKYLQETFADKGKVLSGETKKSLAEKLNGKRLIFLEQMKKGDLADDDVNLEIRFRQFIEE